MAVPWTAPQESRVRSLIDSHPVGSGRCRDLATAILPIARERDDAAAALKIRPMSRLMRFVVPRVPLEEPWSYHVTTTVEAHCVDALTGAAGTERVDYLHAHFEHADALRVELIDLETP